MCGTNGTCATQELGGITGAPHTGAPHTPTCTLYMCIYMCISAYTFGSRHGPCEHGSRVPIGGSRRYKLRSRSRSQFVSCSGPSSRVGQNLWSTIVDPFSFVATGNEGAVSARGLQTARCVRTWYRLGRFIGLLFIGLLVRHTSLARYTQISLTSLHLSILMT